eukprot:TRINITY_DN19982_c0_g1_i2.p1 TRINITY_DN19982_c0_g1~~TRINITY_DN19982_c0_g1_i2.p1  ORF type:complete len:430 (-),score=54.59 TRINITY_DN19982_c0_g1_i2:449-1738(-)
MAASSDEGALCWESRQLLDSRDDHSRQSQSGAENSSEDDEDKNIGVGGVALREVSGALQVDEDVADAVLVAAFGGVYMQLTEHIQERVHPFWLFLVDIPVLCVQSFLLLAMRMDYDPQIPLSDDPFVTRVRLTLVVLLQIFIFSEIQHAVQLCLFAMNPTTWMDMNPYWKMWKRTEKSKLHRVFYNRLFLAIWPTVALLLKVSIVCYWVSVESLSIILTSNSVADAIFNSLALTFIQELDDHTWRFLKVTFHLHVRDNFRFKLRYDDKLIKAREDHVFRCMYPFLGARRTESILASAVLCILYIRQFGVVLFAIRRKVLPAVRDVCNTWYWSHHWPVLGPVIRWIMTEFTDDRFERTADPGSGGYCSSDMNGMTLQDTIDTLASGKGLAGMLAIVGLVFAPQLIIFFWGNIAMRRISETAENKTYHASN